MTSPRPRVLYVWGFAAAEALCNRLKQMTSLGAPSISDGNLSLLHAQLY